MSESSILCPHCQKTIELTEAVTRQVEARLRGEYEDRLVRERDQSAQQLVAQLARERTRIAEQEKRKAADAIDVELADLREQLGERSRSLEAARKMELDIRRQKRELEDRERANALELQRRLDAERATVAEQLAAKLAEEHRFKDREKDQQLEAMRRQIEVLRQKAEQGSQQAQGEALELELEQLLRAHFPADEISPVEPGRRGADVLHGVRNAFGQACGALLWESKRTKAFSDGWIAKLKDDQREAKAELAILVTQVLPKDVQRFASIQGVWVTDFASAMGLACALRMHLVELAAARTALEGRGEKMELLYQHLTSPEFRQRIEAIVETVATMKDELHREQRAMERMWVRREGQIHRVIQNTIRIYGALQGIAGAQLPALKSLELPGEVEDSALDE